ncbi:MAG TPA: ABC transporter ATP-binding protein [Puia sp.]|nr:ABC transporter ATP-binding protein [Puia sp.]
MKLLLGYLSQCKGLIFLALLLAAVDQVFINFIPYIFGVLIVDPFASKVHYFKTHGLEKDFMQGIITGILLVIFVSTVAWVSKGFQNYLLNVLTRKVGVRMYNDVQSHTLRLPYQDFEDARSGEVLSGLQRAKLDTETFLTKFVNVLFVSVIGLCVVTFVSYRLSLWLPIVYILGAIVLVLVSVSLGKKIKKMQQDILEESHAMAGSMTESLRNMELVKSLGLVEQETRRFQDTNARILRSEIRKIKKIRSIGFLYGSFVQTHHQVIMFLLLLFLYHDKLTVGQLFMMQIYFYFVFGGLSEANIAIISYYEAKVSLNHLQELLNRPVEFRPEHPEKLGPVKQLRFEHIVFGYRSSSHPALDNVSFEVKKGESIAIVGPSGSGKTTLIKLLTGLYPVGEGTIYCNHLPHTSIDFNELRHQIGLVTQDAQLFSGSIRDNLLFVCPGASEESMQQALEQAACQNLLLRAPEGIHTLIGEGGLKLSGGERQRLSIARSLLRTSGILIFDEATSSLDSLTEKEIVDTVRQIANKQSYITIMIAHRLSTIMFADRIYVLSKGKIIETGTHEELLACEGLYNAMWRQQTGELREAVAV